MEMSQMNNWILTPGRLRHLRSARMGSRGAVARRWADACLPPAGWSRFGMVLALLGSLLAATAQAACPSTTVTRSVSSSNNWKTITISELETINSVSGGSGLLCSYTKIHPNQFRYRRCSGTFSFTGPAASCPSDSGPLEISQVPLFLGGQVDPNIMFILDDSGSMQFEIMPDDYTMGDTRYVFPRANGVYGSSDYANYVATVDNNNAYAALTRSPQVNTVYYDPGITYLPWIKWDGTEYPNADPECALHNPERSGTMQAYCRDLTETNDNYNSNRWVSCNSNGSCSSTGNDKDFWPATYYWKADEASDVWHAGSYTKIQIKPTTPTYSGHGREGRSDCTDGVCTYAQEIQNFANWYTYHRSRILAARAGIGRAFADQGTNMRIGYAAINKGGSSVDGVNNTETVVRGVRPFSGSNRRDFYEDLYTRDIPAAGTPLRKALDDVGQYFSRSDNAGPWGAVPGSNDTTPHLACRQSYAILMTDGYWSGGSTYDAETADARKNVDNASGPEIEAPDGTSYQYSPTDPYRDSHSNTLADVAMYYWKRDLREHLANRVPITPSDPAFWQHMVTFGVGLGVTGSVAPADAWSAVNEGDAIDWLNPSPSTQNCSGTTCAARLDDLLHAAVNSHGDFFSAKDSHDFSIHLSAILSNIVDRTRTSSTTTAINSVRLDTDSLAYQATLNSSDWSGELVAYEPSVVEHRLVLTEKWNAATLIPAHGARTILSNSGTTTGGLTGKGINFIWSALNATQTGHLGSQEIVNYLRGDHSNEQRHGGTLRDRASDLGHIVNSDPVYVATEHFGFHLLPGADGGTSYQDFVLGKSQRKSMVYVGANDGMLHGFDGEDGHEVFAYVPNAVYPRLAELAEPGYAGHFLMDGDIHVSDAFLDATWKSILLGATGAAGRAVFALDVTDPEAMNRHKVLWEFSSASDADLGYTIGKPVIARLNGGTWAAIFGNGYNSDSQRAQLFIVNLQTGALIRKIDTGVGDDDEPNGLASPAFVYDAQGQAKYVYAGDLHGNLWKFDLSHNNSAQWDVAFTSGQNKFPLFTARNASGQIQPITVEPDIQYHPDGGYLVFFGTGRFFLVGDAEDQIVQSVYGIRDDDTRITAVNRSTLQEQELIFEGTHSSGFEVRTISNTAVDWTTKDGWYLDLVSPTNGSEGERVIHPPHLWFDRIRFATNIPQSDPCSGGMTGWLLELDFMTGGRVEKTLFDLDGDGEFDEDDQLCEGEDCTPPSGLRRHSGTGVTPTIFDGELEYLVDEEGIGIRSQLDRQLGRKSWLEIR